MTALGQKRTFSDDLSNVRYGSKADIRRPPVERPLSGAKRTSEGRRCGIASRMSAIGGKADVTADLSACPLIARSGHCDAGGGSRHGIRFIMFTDRKWKKLDLTCPGCQDAAMQVSHQRRRHNANPTWPKYRQQFNSGAPALDSLISGDVSAHAMRIGVHNRGGKLLGNGFGSIPDVRRLRSGVGGNLTVRPTWPRRGKIASCRHTIGRASRWTVNDEG